MLVGRAAHRSEQLALAAGLRGDGVPPGQIGRELRERYGLNGRQAQRVARGWTQEQSANAWSVRWPHDQKTFKNISAWEMWPAPTGNAPSLVVLDRLAQLYLCDVADLVADWGRHREPAAEDEGGAGTKAFGWQVENLPLPELTRTALDWARHLPAESRRALLLKLSTAAAAAAGLVSPSTGVVGAFGAVDDLAGLWTSQYSYHSSGRGLELAGTHHIELAAADGRLTGTSDPTDTGKLELDLRVEGLLATGTWTERTASDGYYRGAVYHGVLQMVIDPTGRRMRGRWLGPDKDFVVDTGTWSLERGRRSDAGLRDNMARIPSATHPRRAHR